MLICAMASFVGCNTAKFADVWSYDEESHWHAPLDETSEEVADQGEHIMSDWIDIPDANPEDSKKYKQCEVCDYKIFQPLIPSEGLEITDGSDFGFCSVKGIGTCTDENIIIPETNNGYPVQALSLECFKDETSIKSIVLPDTIQKISYGAFENCTSLERIYLGAGMAEFNPSRFSTCTSLKNFVVSPKHKYYQSIDGNVYSKDGKTMLGYAIGKPDETFTISNNIERIENYCFVGSKLKSVVFSNGVKEIGEHAFENCASLESVALGNNLEKIEDYAFLRAGVKSITIPESVISIGKAAFRESQLESINILCEINILESNLFAQSALKSIVIPASVETLDQTCFSGCHGLTSVVMGTNVTKIDWCAFENIPNLTIHYKGTEEQCGAITKEEDWNKNSTIVWDYNYSA